jgi:integrase/recombinase XerD
MAAAGELRGALHPSTVQTLIGLMAVTGMQIGGDDPPQPRRRRPPPSAPADHRQQVRQEPRARAAREHDGRAGQLRRAARPALPAAELRGVFISRNGTSLFSSCVNLVFARLVRTVGLEPRSARCRPRPHDLRHSFTVSTLLDWYATDTTNVQARLPSLSTHMGHVEPASTYYYLTAAPELLALAARRLEPAQKGLCSRPLPRHCIRQAW